MTINPKYIIVALLILVGWYARGWFEDSKDLAAAKAIERSREVMRELAADIGTKTEDAIKGIKIENRTIYRKATKEIIEKPIYRECVLPDDGLSAVNAARSAAGKPADPMRGSKPAP